MMLWNFTLVLKCKEVKQSCFGMYHWDDMWYAVWSDMKKQNNLRQTKSRRTVQRLQDASKATALVKVVGACVKIP